MTEFEDAVIGVIASLEPGEVMTYGEVAAEAGHPGAARAVGTLLRIVGAEIPWWRVVGSSGVLKAPNTELQAQRLADDGVMVVKGRVALTPHRPSSRHA